MVLITLTLIVLICGIAILYGSLKMGYKLPVYSIYLNLGYVIIMLSGFVLTTHWEGSFGWIQDLFLATVPSIILAVIVLKYAELKTHFNEKTPIKHAYFPIGVVLLHTLLFLYLTLKQEGELFNILKQVWEYAYIVTFFLIIPGLFILYFILMLICSVRERRIQANWREIIDLVGFAGCFIGFIFKQLVSSNAFEIVYFTYLLIYFCSSALIVIHRSKNQTKPIEEKIQVDVMDRIHNGFKTLFEEEKIYLDATLNLRHLTKRLQSNEKYVSSYINTTYNMSFTSFVNRCRVDEAKRLLLDLKNAQFTIETIAQMAGFQNKSTFNLAFKKETGETPSQFKAKNLS